MDEISQESMSFAEGSPAKTSAPPEKERASMGKGRGSSLKCSASSAEPDPLFASLKTFMLCELGGGDRVLADLEESGYAGRAFVVGAWAAGAPHKRDRV